MAFFVLHCSRFVTDSITGHDADHQALAPIAGACGAHVEGEQEAIGIGEGARGELGQAQEEQGRTQLHMERLGLEKLTEAEQANATKVKLSSTSNHLVAIGT